MVRHNIRFRLASMLLASAAVAASAFAEANVWWVDDDNYGKTGMDGTSAATAFGSVQEAIDNPACLAGDTIKVLPGIYDEGVVESRDGDTITERNRIVIGKKLDIVAVGSKEETHIVGRHSPESEGGDPESGAGPTAVRCVRVTEGGLGSTLSGFTIRDSATCERLIGNAEGCGGSVSVEDASKDFLVTDCVISNTVSRYYGGASFGGTFVRCLISDSRAHSYSSALHSGDALFCVMAHCRLVNESSSSRFCTLDNGNGSIVNCTIYGGSSVRPSSYGCYNCLFLGNKRSETNGVNEAANVYASHGAAYRNAEPQQLNAPALGNFRPLPSSAVFGAGETRYLTAECPLELPADMVIRDMDGTPVDLTGDRVAAGAYVTPETPKYGGVLLTVDCKVNGFPSYGTNLFFASSWPVQVKVTEPYFLRVSEAPGSDELSTRWPGTNGYICITPPYQAGLIQTYTRLSTGTNNFYVDAVNGDDDSETHGADKPYATLQKAMDSYKTTGKLAVIHLAEGDYSIGGGVGRGVTNRVNITGAKWFKIVATGDPAKTIIRGAAAKNERDPENHPGCGPDAVRCVNFSYSVDEYDHSIAFVGVTFADGHTDVGQDADNDMGGGVYGRPGKRGNLQFIDCVFTNCYAPAAGIGARARFVRCRFVDCGGSTDGFRESLLSSCVVEDGDFGTGALGLNTRAAGCTVLSEKSVADASGLFILNSIVKDGTVFPGSAMTWGTTDSTCLADPGNGDFRPVSGSPALDASCRGFPTPGDDGWDDFVKYVSCMSTDGFDGNPWICNGGYPVAGAYMDWVRGVWLWGEGAEWITVEGASSGANPLPPGSVVTVSRNADAVRRWGVVVNGVTNDLDSGSATYVIDAGSGMNDGSIFMYADPNWYVNPDPSVGDDSNSGFTAAAPKLTLKGVLSVATNAGDVVHAAPGVYDSGEMIPSSVVSADEEENWTYRAALSGDVTLKATGNADDTAIVGETGVRGVFFGEGARLIGFTVRDCVTTDGNWGAALVGLSTDESTVVADCVVSNCATEAHSAGSHYISHVFRTRFHNCYRQKTEANKNEHRADGVTGRGGRYYNCLFDGNGSKYEFYRNGEMKNCTFGSKGTPTVRYSTENILNTLMLRSPREGSELFNCWLSATNSINTGGEDITTLDEMCVVTNAESLLLDGDYSPVIGENVSVDTGDWDAYTNNWPLALDPKGPEYDLYGNPRVRNGRMDIGAVEADWRGVYAGTLGGGSGFRVDSASAGVTNATGFVYLPDGGELTASWKIYGGMSAGCSFLFRNVGAGTLYVTVDGETLEYDSPAGIVKFVCAASANSVRISYKADEGDSGYAEIFGFESHRGMRLILR